MSDELALFGAGDPAAAGADQAPKLSADRRRTWRQYEAIRAGRHPLTGWPVHLEAAAVADELPTIEAFHAGETYRKPEQPAPGRRCGNCQFFGQINAYTARDFPKCWFGWDGVPGHAPPRYSHGAATDIRKWWPGCREHEYRTTEQETDQ